MHQTREAMRTDLLMSRRHGERVVQEGLGRGQHHSTVGGVQPVLQHIEQIIHLLLCRWLVNHHQLQHLALRPLVEILQHMHTVACVTLNAFVQTKASAAICWIQVHLKHCERTQQAAPRTWRHVDNISHDEPGKREDGLGILDLEGFSGWGRQLLALMRAGDAMTASDKGLAQGLEHCLGKPTDPAKTQPPSLANLAH